ncbi:hypothetical protein GALMADRAFT_258135 [Galerina marginata CBS 339.88]|uniref:Nephrocystin 3-like N-terminal domain-containing protein n=1 Tax=Galerina marginata (strain CBS 339.88) TaxID=685588 RepID=A0A067S9E5_GALM3|nr:hypothetical protein GALMADRAFT_258135 [Galerina marginata CBS 339.88]
MYSNSNVVVTGGHATYVAGNAVNHFGHSRPGFERLEKQVAAEALHNSGEVSDQPKCHPGTRVAILEYLETWAMAIIFTYPIIWLHGPAGSGKSSILRTIAQILFDRGHLLGSFFFFRSAIGRNSSERFIATIAYQLAVSIPPTRSYIEEAIERNPLVFSLSLWDQAQVLIVSPILAFRQGNRDPSFDPRQFPRVIVVDGLDECNDPSKQCEILQVLCRVLRSLSMPFAVLVASRPEHHIRGAFDLGNLNRSSSRLGLDNSYNPDADIRKYLVESFGAIHQNHPLKSCLSMYSSWPPRDVVSKLVAKASGQFIYAATIHKFISSPRHNPAKRLEMILGTLDAGNLKPFQQLDNLYSMIFTTIDPDDLPDTLRILGVFLVPFTDGRFKTPKFLQRLFKLDAGEIQRLFFDLESLLTVDGEKEARFFHASLGDYLFDSSRSAQFWIEPAKVYADLARHSIIQISRRKSNELKEFFYLNSFLFFSKASATLELRQAIKSCDLKNLIDFSQWSLRTSKLESSANIFSDITPTLLQAIRNSTLSDANRLYLHKLAEYGKLIRPRLQFYFQDFALTQLLISAASVDVEDNERRGHYEALRYLFQVSIDTWYLQEKKHGIYLQISSVALMQVVRELIDGESASSIGCFVDGNQYAAVALYLMKYMTQEPQISAKGNIRQSDAPSAKEIKHLIERVSKILPAVLSKSSVRQDILDFINGNMQSTPGLASSSMKAALGAYISRANAYMTTVNNGNSSRLATTGIRLMTDGIVGNEDASSTPGIDNGDDVLLWSSNSPSMSARNLDNSRLTHRSVGHSRRSARGLAVNQDTPSHSPGQDFRSITAEDTMPIAREGPAEQRTYAGRSSGAMDSQLFHARTKRRH